jgi:hypothetical protein
LGRSRQRTKSRFALNGRAAPTRPVSSCCILYASRRWSGERGPVSPRCACTARAVFGNRDQSGKVKGKGRAKDIYLSRRSHLRRPFRSRLRFGLWVVRLGDRDFAVLTMDSVNIFMLMVADGAYLPHGLLGQCMSTICFESVVLRRAKVFREDSIVRQELSIRICVIKRVRT